MTKTIYQNGLVLTMEERQPAAEAVLTENGRILAVGGQAELAALAPDAGIEDLAGGTLLPGFVDAHSHISAVAQQLLLVNLNPPPTGPCQTADDVVKQFKKELKERKLEAGQWLLGLGYDNTVFPDGAHPTKEQLDQVSRDIPIAAVHASGHLCAVNSRGLELLGYSGKDFPVPAGGVVEPGGLLKENAYLAPEKQRIMRGPGPAEVLASLGRASALYASYGITTAHDGRTTENDYQLLLAGGRQGMLLNDVVMYLDDRAAGAHLPKQNPKLNAYTDRCRAAGYKLYLDGSPQGKTAWLSKPYFQPPKGQPADYRGFPTQKEEDVLAVIRRCVENHWQINVHANGDAAIEQLIRCYTRALAETGSREALRPVVIHCQTVREDQLERMKSIGMLPSFFLDHVYYWGDYHYRSVLGPERASRISPAASALALGMSFTLHQDSPVVPPNILLSVQNACLRRTMSGRILGAEQRISVREALRAVTYGAAYQIFEEDHKGSLAPGKLADFVLLSENPLTLSTEKLSEIRVLKTIKEDREIYRA